MCTLVYGDDGLAMYVDDVRRTDRVTRERIVNEAFAWGMPRTRASEIVDRLVANTSDAIQAAREETPDVPDRIVEVVENQVGALR
jgi:hypothetical protein